MKRRSLDDKNEGWAAFNVEGFPESFDIAIQGLVGYRGRRSEVAGEVLDKGLVKCQIGVREATVPSPSGGHPLACLHVTIVSWLPDNAEEVREVDVDFEFMRQISLALRLFKPELFWLVPWTERQRLRPFRVPSARYRLSDPERKQFHKFVARLYGFQRDRHAYEFARATRHIPETAGVLVDEEIRPFFVGSHPINDEWLMRRAYLMLATDLYEQARTDRHLSAELRLVVLMTAAEAVFINDGRSEIAYRLGHRVAALNGSDHHTRKKVFDEIRMLYDLRSQLVHGTSFSKKKGFVRADEQSVAFLVNAVRASLLYFIGFESSPGLSSASRDDVLRRLDAAVFDPGEVEELRRTANEFWSLGRVSEELLYAKRWEGLT